MAVDAPITRPVFTRSFKFAAVSVFYFCFNKVFKPPLLLL